MSSPEDVNMEANHVEGEEELEAFANNNSSQITQTLETILMDVQLTGTTQYEWVHLRTLIAVKLKHTIQSIQNAEANSTLQRIDTTTNAEYIDRSNELVTKLEQFDGPPFTLQRLVEVLIAPEKSYRRRLKTFVHAVEKLLAVSSTLQSDVAIGDQRSSTIVSSVNPTTNNIQSLPDLLGN